MAQDQSKGQQYVVKATFTDENGRTWQAGTAFTGNEDACKKALAAGKIAEKRDASQGQPKDPDQD